MKKIKMNFFKILMILFILSLFSCSEDLYENESKSSSKFKVEIVNSNALIKNKELMKSLSFNKVLKPSQFGRIVSDTINGLSIDTDNVKYLEGNNFNSYTFNILNQESEKLDNLVLMSQPNGSYKPYVMRYDLTNAEKEALNNGGNVDFTNKTKVLKLYDSNLVSDIFSKLLYQEECSMTYTWEEQITITPCPIDGCLEHPWASYEVSHILVGTLNCSSGGGGGEIGGEIGTAPHGGGVGSGSSKTPCQQLKDNNSKPITNTTPQKTVLDNLNDLTTQMSTVPRERMYVLFPTSTSENQYEESFTQGPLNGGDAELNVSGIYISALMHCHYNTSLLSIFSLSDIYLMYSLQSSGFLLNNGETFTSYLVTAHGTKYAIRFTPPDPNSLNTYNENFFTGWEFDNIKDVKEDEYEDNVNQGNTPAQNELGFLKFVKKQNLGIEIYKADATFSQWSKLSIGTNGQVKATPCP